MDSAMVYRGLDIGTAKPSAAVRASVPHHLIDILDPSEAYSAGRFARDAAAAIDAIAARGRLPLLVGGTLLYLRALRGNERNRLHMKSRRHFCFALQLRQRLPRQHIHFEGALNSLAIGW